MSDSLISRMNFDEIAVNDEQEQLYLLDILWAVISSSIRTVFRKGKDVSLEDEISFQTVYNYFLRLCSFRNTSEVPMVLVGTQGERACSLGRCGSCGSPWASVRKPVPLPASALLALIQTFRWATPTPPL